MLLKTVTFEITNRCNLRCKMCNIWKEEVSDISPDQISKFLNSTIVGEQTYVSITGGEPFLHPKLDEIYRILHRNIRAGKISGMNIVSNGYDTGGIIDFLERNRDILDTLTIYFSIDGLEKNHNIQRGCRDAFRKTVSTIEFIRKEFPQIDSGIKFTINKMNYKDIHKIFSLCRKWGMSFFIKLIENNTVNYYHRAGQHKDRDMFYLDNGDKKAIKRELIRILRENEKDRVTDSNFIKILIRHLGGEEIVEKCVTPLYFLFVTCRGDIYPCLYEKPIANIMKKEWSNMIYSRRHKNIINKGLRGECRKCLSYHGFLKNWNFMYVRNL